MRGTQGDRRPIRVDYYCGAISCVKTSRAGTAHLHKVEGVSTQRDAVASQKACGRLFQDRETIFSADVGPGYFRRTDSEWTNFFGQGAGTKRWAVFPVMLLPILRTRFDADAGHRSADRFAVISRIIAQRPWWCCRSRARTSVAGGGRHQTYPEADRLFVFGYPVDPGAGHQSVKTTPEGPGRAGVGLGELKRLRTGNSQLGEAVREQVVGEGRQAWRLEERLVVFPRGLGGLADQGGRIVFRVDALACRCRSARGHVAAADLAGRPNPAQRQPRVAVDRGDDDYKPRAGQGCRNPAKVVIGCSVDQIFCLRRDTETQKETPRRRSNPTKKSKERRTGSIFVFVPRGDLSLGVLGALVVSLTEL